MARCDSDVCATRQSCKSCGGGNHDINVDSVVCSVECNVGSVEVDVVFIWVLWWVVIVGCWGGTEDLFMERAVAGEPMYEVD